MTDDNGTGPGRRDSPLSMTPETFRELGHSLVDELSRLMAAVPSNPITRDSSTTDIRRALGIGQPLPTAGADPKELLPATAAALFEHSLFNAHPRFFGYITAPPAPIGVLGDFIAAALNPNVGSRTLSPAATEIELEAVRWISELIGYPQTGGGLLVSGGNMANFVGFFAARAARAPWDVRRQGASVDGRRLTAYCSAETHTWIQKAADLSGMGTDAVRWIATDSQQRMKVDALAASIDDDLAAGFAPFIVVGTAGTVSTGAIDPLPAIASLCRERGLWFHVDGAYGGFAAAVDDVPVDILGLRQADSVAVDPHKWLYAPLEAGCALVRDTQHLRNAFSYHPAYYHFDEHVNFVDFGMQNSRGFRALKVWLALKHAGADGYRRMIADDMSLSREMADAISRHPDLELVTQSLSIATFRYVPRASRASLGTPETEEYLNTLNTRILERLQREGEAFVSNAVVAGRFVLRACVVNFHTSVGDVLALPSIVARAGAAAAAELRD